MKTVYFITGNKGKLLEAKEKLFDVDIEVVQKNLGYPEIQAVNLEDVARFGAEHIQKIFDKPFIYIAYALALLFFLIIRTLVGLRGEMAKAGHKESLIFDRDYHFWQKKKSR